MAGVARRVLVIVAMVVGLATGGPLPDRAGAAEPPAAPTDVVAVPADGEVNLWWSVDDGWPGPAPQITITPFVGGVAQPSIRASRTTSHTVTGLANGTAYRFTVSATTEAGTSPPSARTRALTPRPWAPYATADRLIRRMHRLFAFRGPTPGERATWSEGLAGGTHRTDLILGLIDGPAWDDSYGAVTRLYSTMLNRTVDLGGLRYWAEAVRTGSLTLAQVAQRIGGTREFRDRSGLLTDAEYVDQVFTGAVGRRPSAADRAYWEGRLTSGLPRWRLSLLLGEAAERGRGSRNHTTVVALNVGLLDHVPDINHMAKDLSDLGEGFVTLNDLIEEALIAQA